MNENRNGRALVAQETLKILETGTYTTIKGIVITLSDELEKCKAGTKLYRPDSFSQIELPTAEYKTKFEVTKETTLSAGRRLCGEDDPSSVVALNFASAKNPGGGFLGGSQAQEESLARSSGLYDSLLTQQEYYDINRQCKSTFYTEHMIYSPLVPVFRDDNNQLLESPYCINMVTSPAVNRGALVQHNSDRLDEIEDVMRGRISNLLRVVLENGNENLILGAWGCGVFRNSPQMIASLFKEAFTEEFKNCFKQVVFAIPGRGKSSENLEVFGKQFES